MRSIPILATKLQLLLLAGLENWWKEKAARDRKRILAFFGFGLDEWCQVLRQKSPFHALGPLPTNRPLCTPPARKHLRKLVERTSHASGVRRGRSFSPIFFGQMAWLLYFPTLANSGLWKSLEVWGNEGNLLLFWNWDWFNFVHFSGFADRLPEGEVFYADMQPVEPPSIVMLEEVWQLGNETIDLENEVSFIFQSEVWKKEKTENLSLFFRLSSQQHSSLARPRTNAQCLSSSNPHCLSTPVSTTIHHFSSWEQWGRWRAATTRSCLTRAASRQRHLRPSRLGHHGLRVHLSWAKNKTRRWERKWRWKKERKKTNKKNFELVFKAAYPEPPDEVVQ